MRSTFFLPRVSGAVRTLPRRSFQRASRSPLRKMISAPGGGGLVTCYLNTVPKVSPILSFASPCPQFQAEVCSKPVRNVEAKGLPAGHKPHDATSLDPCFPFQGLVGH